MKRVFIIGLALCLAACAQSSNMPSPNLGADTGAFCGTRGLPATCQIPQDFCKWSVADQCGATDKPGVCTPRPEMCTMQYDPVCGCDGQTYSNACVANSEGVSVKSLGECAN